MNMGKTGGLRNLGIVLTALLLLASLGFASGALAQSSEKQVTYLDKDGKTQTVWATIVTRDTKFLTGLYGGWYVAVGTVETGCLGLDGNVNLILENGCHMTADSISYTQAGPGIAVPEGQSLTIYAQSYGTGMGKLTAIGTQNSAGIGTSVLRKPGTICIVGGDITAIGATFAAGIGSSLDCASGTIIITGGNVTAIGGANGAGIGGGSGSEGGSITITGAARVIAMGGAGVGYGAGGGAGIGSGGTEFTSPPGMGTISIDKECIVSATGGKGDEFEDKKYGKGANIGTGGYKANEADPGDGKEWNPTISQPKLEMPQAFKATAGFGYQLAAPIPPGTTFTTGNNKIASVDKYGVLDAKKAGKVTVKARDAGGKLLQCCKITVVANGFTRKKPLMLKGEKGLFASTKKLYYRNNQLYAEVFVYNRSGKTVRETGPVVFELWDKNTLLYRKEIPDWNIKTKLNNKRYKTFKLTITEAMLGGVKNKAYDLGLGNVQALLSGPGLTPLTPGMANVTKPKNSEAVAAFEPIGPESFGMP